MTDDLVTDDDYRGHASTTCAKHNRWTALPSGARRDCPECPQRVHPTHVYGWMVDRVGWVDATGKVAAS